MLEIGRPLLVRSDENAVVFVMFMEMQAGLLALLAQLTTFAKHCAKSTAAELTGQNINASKTATRWATKHRSDSCASRVERRDFYLSSGIVA